MTHLQDPIGLPSPQRAASTPLDAPPAERDGYEYTLPQSILQSPAWQRHGGKFSERDLTIVMVEPGPKDETDAAKFAPNNAELMINRLEQTCLWKIGDRLVRRNQDLLDSYYRAIGIIGRKTIEQIFIRMYQVDPGQIEAVISAGKPVTV